MIWLQIIAAFVIARLKRNLEGLQRINRDICPQEICLRFYERSFNFSWRQHLKPSTDSPIFFIFLVVLHCIPDVDYVRISNFSCHFSIDGLLTNEIALLLPVGYRSHVRSPPGKGKETDPTQANACDLVKQPI